MNCPHCHSQLSTSLNRTTDLGNQMYRCFECKRYFNERTGTPFNFLPVPTDIVFQVLLCRLRYKMSLREVAEFFLLRGFEFTHETVRDWEARFAPIFADQLRAKRTRQLIVQNGAAISSAHSGSGSLGGNGGNMIVNASEFIELTGQGNRRSALVTEANGIGDAGNLTIVTGKLSVRDDAIVSALTLGRGNAGNIFVRTSGSVDLARGYIRSGVLSRAVGNGGIIDIEADSLSLTNGAQILSETSGQGNAGNVSIDVRDAVVVTGADNKGFSSLISSNVAGGGVGDAGNINIQARSLTLSSSGQINVSSEGSGDAGNLEAMADSIHLENLALLSSDTTAGQGNIFLRSGDLVLRRGSNISTNAKGTATGGNITIDTDILAALENSDITANAQNAFGGQVRIFASGIFGTELRNQETLESDPSYLFDEVKLHIDLIGGTLSGDDTIVDKP